MIGKESIGGSSILSMHIFTFSEVVVLRADSVRFYIAHFYTS
jgi:hypothetical protein